jgi:hypothetical protein
MFFDDPEGPNLLVIYGLAAILFCVSLLAYVFSFQVSTAKKFLLALFVQIIMIIGISFFF